MGQPFKAGEALSSILEIYQDRFPQDEVKTKTALVDGLRALAGMDDGPVQKIGHGQYKLTRRLTNEDAQRFNRNYWRWAARGKEYKKMKKMKQMKGEKTMPKNKKDQTDGITKLGDQRTKYVYDNPGRGILETFPNQYPERDYVTEFVFTEFSSLCPKTGQPDFATIKVQYIADEKCIETKSLKLYYLAFRQYGSFMETITNKILEDLVSVCNPRWMKVTGNFSARGGTLINVEAEAGSGRERT